jgi:hypothetical protein
LNFGGSLFSRDSKQFAPIPVADGGGTHAKMTTIATKAITIHVLIFVQILLLNIIQASASPKPTQPEKFWEGKRLIWRQYSGH